MLATITFVQLSCLLGGVFAAPAAEKPPFHTGPLLEPSAILNCWPYLLPPEHPVPTFKFSDLPLGTWTPPITKRPGISHPPFGHPTPTTIPIAHPPIGHPTIHPTLIPLPRPIEPPILPLKDTAVEERSEQAAANADIANNLSRFRVIVDDVKERVAQVETSVRDINATVPISSTQLTNLIPGLTTQLGGILGTLTGLPSVVAPLTNGLGDLTGALLGGAGALLDGKGAGAGTSGGTTIGSPLSGSPIISYLSLWAQLFNALGQLTAYFFNTGPLAALAGPLLAPITSSLSSILGTVGGAIPLNSS